MTELETMMRAKAYIESLANGKNPLTGQYVKDDDIINNVRISRCLFYVSGVLQKVIDNGGEVQKSKSKKPQREQFNLTDEQKMSLKPDKFSLSSAKITALINTQIDTDKMKKLKVTTLNGWLVGIGLLTEVITPIGKIRRVPTTDGEMLGLSETEFADSRGVHKYVIYNPNAQQFIFDNIDSVIEFAHNEELEKKK
ncbi:MAG: hypothetical protein E7497_07185 [Ruminococcus sp.]|nr:hypothetical protein [Ruminococcus sp.]